MGIKEEKRRREKNYDYYEETEKMKKQLRGATKLQEKMKLNPSIEKDEDSNSLWEDFCNSTFLSFMGIIILIAVFAEQIEQFLP